MRLMLYIAKKPRLPRDILKTLVQTEDLVCGHIKNIAYVCESVQRREFVKSHIFADRGRIDTESFRKLFLRDTARSYGVPQPHLYFVNTYHIQAKNSTPCHIFLDNGTLCLYYLFVRTKPGGSIMKKRILCATVTLLLVLALACSLAACSDSSDDKTDEAAKSLADSGLVGTWVYEYEWYVDDPSVLFTTNTDPHYEKVFEMLIIKPSTGEEGMLSVERSSASITASSLRVDLEEGQSSVVKYNYTVTGRLGEDPETYSLRMGNKYSTARREIVMADADTFTVDIGTRAPSESCTFTRTTMTIEEWKAAVNEYRNDKIDEWGYSHYIPD